MRDSPCTPTLHMRRMLMLVRVMPTLHTRRMLMLVRVMPTLHTRRMLMLVRVMPMHYTYDRYVLYTSASPSEVNRQEVA